MNKKIEPINDLNYPPIFQELIKYQRKHKLSRIKLAKQLNKIAGTKLTRHAIDWYFNHPGSIPNPELLTAIYKTIPESESILLSHIRNGKNNGKK